MRIWGIEQLATLAVIRPYSRTWRPLWTISMVATVLGLGLGWPQNEHEADGIDFGTAARRLRSLDGVE